MIKLECVYLMNVALYLKLTDIPKFVLVNHKTKEACDGLRINPINDGENDLKKSLKTIISYFPKLETLYLTKQALKKVFDNRDNYEIPNVEIFKSNDYLTIGLITKSSAMGEGINKVAIGLNTLRQHYSLPFVQSIKIDINSIPQIEPYFKQMKFLKRIFLKCCFNQMCNNSIIIDKINNISKNYDVILEFEKIWGNYYSTWDRFKEIENLLQPSIIVKYNCCYGIKEQYKIAQFPKTQEEFDGDLWCKRITKDYYPLKLKINTEYNTKYIKLFESVQTIKICGSGTYQLPSSIETIESNRYSQVVIGNWEELKEIKQIKHYDYNINTPSQFRKYEKNIKKRDFKEKVLFCGGFVRIITIILSLLSIIQSIIGNGFFNLKEHYITLFPYLWVSLITHIITFGIHENKSYWKPRLIDNMRNVGTFLIVTQYLIILFYDQRYYGSFYSEVLFLICISFIFYLFDGKAITDGFGSGYVNRKIEFFTSIFDFLGNESCSGHIEISQLVVFFSFSFLYCFISSLDITNGFLFIGNVINSILSIYIFYEFMQVEDD